MSIPTHDLPTPHCPQDSLCPACESRCDALEPRSSYLDIAEALLKALREQDDRIAEMESFLFDEPDDALDPARFFTVRRYAALHDLRLSITQLKAFDRHTAKFCRKIEARTGRAYDRIFGESATYHFQALDEAYAAWTKGGAL